MNNFLDRVNAETLAIAHVKGLAEAVGDEFSILVERTVEHPKGWVFFYNSADFVRTGNFVDALAGNGPILVLSDGTVKQLPSSVPWEEAIERI